MEWIIWAFVAAIGFKIVAGIFDAVREFVDIIRPRGRPQIEGSKPSVGEFEIVYRDRNGEVTRRVIKPFFRSDERDPIISAYCATRRDVRSFRMSRIVECVDLETGEVVDNLAMRVPTGESL